MVHVVHVVKLHKRSRQICSLRSWCGTANTGEAMKKTICWEGQPEPRVAIYGNWQISILGDWDKKKSSWSPLRLTFVSVHLFSSKTFQDGVFHITCCNFYVSFMVMKPGKTAQVFAMHAWISLSPWHGRHNLWRKSAHRTWRNNHDRNSGVGSGYATLYIRLNSEISAFQEIFGTFQNYALVWCCELQRLCTPLEWLLLCPVFVGPRWFCGSNSQLGTATSSAMESFSWQVGSFNLRHEHSSTVEVTCLDKKNGDIFLKHLVTKEKRSLFSRVEWFFEDDST